MSNHYLYSHEVAHRINEINQAARQRNLAQLAVGKSQRKPGQRVLRVIGWALISVGERLYQQSEPPAWPVTTPAETPCG